MTGEAVTVEELLVACLRAGGVQRIFGAGGLGDLANVQVDDVGLAALLADADGRLGPGVGAAWVGEGRLRLSSRPDATPRAVPVGHVEDLPLAIASVGADSVHDCVELHLDVDLAAPAPTDLTPLSVQRDAPPAPVLAPDLLAAHPVVVAGPGVLRQPGGVEALRDVAERLGLGVLNTFGAKGLFRWDDPHHHGTIGLQERDGELAGLDAAPLLVLVGIDPDELPASWLERAPTLEVGIEQLPALALRAPDEPPDVAERPELYRALASALADRYTAEDVPLAPARAAADLAAALPSGGLVAADPGPAGLWVGRALPTVEPGSVVVPATGAPGVAVALALAAALRGRRAVAVTTSPLGDRTLAMCDLAAALGADLTIAAWGEGAALGSATEHAQQVRAALTGPGVQTLQLPVALAETRLLWEVAGPVAPWAGRQN